MCRIRKKLLRAWRCQHGFSLVETLVAIAVLAVIAVGFLSALSGGYLALLLADENTVAESLTRAELEKIRDSGFNPDAVDSVNEWANTGYWVQKKVVGVEEDPLNMQEWTVVIFHSPDSTLTSEEELLTTITYKVPYTKTLLDSGV